MVKLSETKYIHIPVVLLFALIISVIKTHVYDDDFYGYYQHYLSYLHDGIYPIYSEGKEFVLSLVVIFIALFNVENIYLFSFLVKALNFLLVYLFLRKFGKNNEFIIVLLFLSPLFIMYSDSFIRQSLSLSLLLIALTELNNKRYVYFLMSIFTHISSIIYFPVINKRIEPKILFVFFILSIFTHPISYSFLESILDFFNLTDKLYFSNQIMKIDSEVLTNPSIFSFLPTVAIICTAFITRSNFSNMEVKLINIFILAMIFMNVLVLIPYASSRIGILIYCYTPLLFVLLKGRSRIALICVIYFYYWYRFITRENPSMELNFQYLIWPFN